MKITLSKIIVIYKNMLEMNSIQKNTRNFFMTFDENLQIRYVSILPKSCKSNKQERGHGVTLKNNK